MVRTVAVRLSVPLRQRQSACFPPVMLLSLPTSSRAPMPSSVARQGRGTSSAALLLKCCYRRVVYMCVRGVEFSQPHKAAEWR